MDNYVKGRYLSTYEWEQRKARNNRLLGFVVGVLCTISAFIMWSLIQ